MRIAVPCVEYRRVTAQGNSRPAEAGSARIRVSLELDLDAQPIEGTLNLPGGQPSPFTGWLGLTAALEAFREGEQAVGQ